MITRREGLALAAGLTLAPLPARAGDFDDFLADVGAEARRRGVSARTLSAAFAGVSPDPKVIELSNRQPEYKDTIGDYVDRRVSLKRVTNGRAAFAKWQSTFQEVEARYGVPGSIVAGVWGMETSYGTSMGDHYIIRALATLAYQGRRRDYFRSELINALAILEAGDVEPAAMKGSWAGAMGHTQFMPSSFLKLAVDFDGDGRRDIWNDIPDALGSAGHYLRKAGWTPGVPWGFEVTGGSAGRYPRSVKKSLSEWASLGLSRPGGGAIAGSAAASLWQPMEEGGPTLLITSNFGVIKRYNNADSYALGVAHLGDRIRGGQPFSKPWPAGPDGVTQAHREEIQRRLNAMGFDLGEPDGLIGDKTKAAIAQVQGRFGMEQDGKPSLELLQRLRK